MLEIMELEDELQWWYANKVESVDEPMDDV
jgi:hypothetical protein